MVGVVHDIVKKLEHCFINGLVLLSSELWERLTISVLNEAIKDTIELKKKSISKLVVRQYQENTVVQTRAKQVNGISFRNISGRLRAIR